VYKGVGAAETVVRINFRNEPAPDPSQERNLFSARAGLLPSWCVFSAMVGTARCAVPARVAAGGTNYRAALAFEGVAPLYAARTSQRDVPTTLTMYPSWEGSGVGFSAWNLFGT